MKKGLKTLIGGILLFVIGAIVVPVAFILPLILDDTDDRQFVIPGNTEVQVAEPGRYYLWNDFRTVHDGASYNRSESIPDGLRISVVDGKGNNLPFRSDASITSSSGTSSRKSIGYVEVTEPGKLTVSVTGDSDERVFSFARSGIMRIFGLIFGGIALSMLMVLAGVGVSILGIVRLTSNRKDGGVRHPPSLG